MPHTPSIDELNIVAESIEMNQYTVEALTENLKEMEKLFEQERASSAVKAKDLAKGYGPQF